MLRRTDVRQNFFEVWYSILREFFGWDRERVWQWAESECIIGPGSSSLIFHDPYTTEAVCYILRVAVQQKKRAAGTAETPDIVEVERQIRLEVDYPFFDGRPIADLDWSEYGARVLRVMARFGLELPLPEATGGLPERVSSEHGRTSQEQREGEPTPPNHDPPG